MSLSDAKSPALRQAAAKARSKALVDLSACTGCEVCVAVCPVPGCIRQFGEGPRDLGVYVNYDVCIGCQLCVKNCPWDTIKMVPTPTVAGHKTSLDSQPNHEHEVFRRPELVPEEIRSFVEKPPFSDPAATPLFQKQNPQVPNIMGPK